MSPRIILPAWRLARMLKRASAVAEDSWGDYQVLACVHLTSTAEDLYALGTDRYAAVVVRAGGGVGSAAHGTSNLAALIGLVAGVVLVHLTRDGEVR